MVSKFHFVSKLILVSKLDLCQSFTCVEVKPGVEVSVVSKFIRCRSYTCVEVAHLVRSCTHPQGGGEKFW